MRWPFSCTLYLLASYSDDRVFYLVFKGITGFYCAKGVSLPAIHVMLSKWAPPAERNRISSLSYAGNPVHLRGSVPADMDPLPAPKVKRN